MPLLPPLLLSSLLAGVIAGEGSDSAAEQAQLPYDGPQYMAVKKNGKVIHGDMVGFEGTGKPMLADPVAVFLVKLGAPEAEAMEISAHLLKEHGIETAHQLKDAVPADCADSPDCPSTLSALMNNANGSEITQNGLRFLQKEYDEKGLTHPDDEDDVEAGEFTATKTRQSHSNTKKGGNNKERIKKNKHKDNQAENHEADAHKTERVGASGDFVEIDGLQEKEEQEANKLEAAQTQGQQQQQQQQQQQIDLDNGIEAIVKELVAIYDKAGRLEAMHGEDGVRLASYYEPGAPDRLTKAQAFLELVKRRFGAKMAQKDDL